jgi:hypothetical protein
MQVRKETILNVFPSSDPQHRLVIAIEQIGTSGSMLVLRQETHAEDVGWFVQSRVTVEPDQVAGLKMALSSGNAKTNHPPTRENRPVPAILRFGEAIAHQAG